MPDFKAIQFQASRYIGKAKTFVREATASKWAGATFALILVFALTAIVAGHVFGGIATLAALFLLMAFLREGRNGRKVRDSLQRRLKREVSEHSATARRSLNRGAENRALNRDITALKVAKNEQIRSLESRLEAPEKIWKERLALQTASHKEKLEAVNAKLAAAKEANEYIRTHLVPIPVDRLDMSHGDTEWATIGAVPDYVPFHGHHLGSTEDDRHITCATLIKVGGQAYFLRQNRTRGAKLEDGERTYSELTPFRTDFRHDRREWLNGADIDDNRKNSYATQKARGTEK